ncbi:MAG: kinase [Deltaproteobacteria bacterium]|nr:kinase [Deltaproteobacteria bacterium]MBT6436340.1 kinase [Deltaproteobacteria bacterium]MBT6488379.1 kinase [Deltaproteobacteria bacterium]
MRKEMRTLGHPIIVGISGIQGSGKTTQSRALQNYLKSHFGMTTCILSIDDFYRDQKERQLLSERIHPLLKTRGVPGTHHVEAISAVIDALKRGADESIISIPQFDKSTDNPKAVSDWKDQKLPVDVILFEGWCVGAQPQSAQELAKPINQLEEQEDAEGTFRNYVNKQLQEQYASLWKKIDTLVWLQPSKFEMVYTWRKQQESQLEIDPNNNTSTKMDDADLNRFIMHYERISRHMMNTMPKESDWVIELNDDQTPKLVRHPDGHSSPQR